MQFCYQPGHESGCGHSNRCPHLGGASVGMLVEIVNTGEDGRLNLHRQLDAEREHNSKLVAENLLLEKALEQAKLELKLERQNKFATNEQKDQDDQASEEAPAAEGAKKRGAPVGHPGWFRPTPTEYDRLVEVAAPRRCPHCCSYVSTQDSADLIDHLQEDIVENVYQVVCYQHQAGRCDDCGRWVQQAGQDEILNSHIAYAVWRFGCGT